MAQLGEGRLNGKVALVTGAARGIGRAASMLFAAQGARVVGLDVDEALLAQTVSDVQADGGQMIGMKADVTRADEVSAAVAEGVREFGTLNIVFNNAAVLGHQYPQSVVDAPEEVWDMLMNVNVKSMFLVCKYSVPELMKAGTGSIVNMSSINALFGETIGVDCYCTAKAAVLGLTHSLAVWLAPHHIRVNAILPGMVNTPAQRDLMADPGIVAEIESAIPFARVGTAEEIANLALFLASDEASYMTGADVVIDGGCAVI